MGAVTTIDCNCRNGAKVVDYRGRSSSPTRNWRPRGPYSSTSSSSSLMNGRTVPRSSSTSANFAGGYESQTPMSYPSMEDQLFGEQMENASGSAYSISVTIRFRPLREYHRGDEVAWYVDGDTIVRNEYNSMISYGFGLVVWKTVYYNIWRFIIELLSSEERL